MSLEERYGTRDGAYSAWHRPRSIARFVGIEAAQLLSLIDIDIPIYVEYDESTKEPLALIETAIDVGQRTKPSTVTCNLAKRANLPAFCVLYTKDKVQLNPADAREMDILQFRVRQLWSTEGPSALSEWVNLTPASWAKWILEVRRRQSKRVDECLKADGLLDPR